MHFQRGFARDFGVIGLTVLGCFSLLAQISRPGGCRHVFTANAAVVTADLEAMQKCLADYALEHGGAFPDQLAALWSPRSDGETYLRGRTSEPRDPWKNFYRYRVTADHRGYRLESLGRDGEPGGRGESADIGVSR